MPLATNDDELEAKTRLLEARLAALGSFVVAYSGGVDSSALLAAAVRAAGDRVLAVTGVSPSLAKVQKDQAVRVAAALGARHELWETKELEVAGYVANAPDRCFFCKDELYTTLRRRLGDDRPIADGTNVDDLGDWRPGRRAAAAHGVLSPLVEAGFTKADVRALSRRSGLETAEMPGSPCLSSRLPYGTSVTAEALALIERAEAAVRAQGFADFRVRHLGGKARVEVAAAEWPRLEAPGVRQALRAEVERAGFLAVEIDDRPLVSGRLNEGVSR